MTVDIEANVIDALLAALLLLKIEESDPDWGICSNVNEILYYRLDDQFPAHVLIRAMEVWGVLSENDEGTLWSDWPKYSGSPRYPVPNPYDNDESPRDVYAHPDPEGMWSTDTPYGVLRRELLDFLIEKFTKWQAEAHARG